MQKLSVSACYAEILDSGTVKHEYRKFYISPAPPNVEQGKKAPGIAWGKKVLMME
jgi:hypothetical protein